MYTIVWGESTVTKTFQKQFSKHYSIGLNSAEPPVTEPALITAEDGKKPRIIQIQAIDKYYRPAYRWNRKVLKLKPSYNHSL